MCSRWRRRWPEAGGERRRTVERKSWTAAVIYGFPDRFLPLGCRGGRCKASGGPGLARGCPRRRRRAGGAPARARLRGGEKREEREGNRSGRRSGVGERDAVLLASRGSEEGGARTTCGAAWARQRCGYRRKGDDDFTERSLAELIPSRIGPCCYFFFF